MTGPRLLERQPRNGPHRAHKITVKSGRVNQDTRLTMNATDQIEPFEEVVNFRDVGRTVNEYLGERFAGSGTTLYWRSLLMARTTDAYAKASSTGRQG